MLVGMALALLAGSLISLQNIFNSKVNERVGSWATTTFVLGMGFLASLLMGLLTQGSHLLEVGQMQPWFWFSGMIGVGVVTSLVQAMKRLRPTFAISIVLTSQLGFALWWDSMGWMGLDKIPFTVHHLFGVFMIIGGMLVFKWSGQSHRA
ncbi:DMT family transporter [Brevibacillus centrosporus]|uniref:DMT family transporter n=1 Tax=Brevibacillus centrosporus TaxID=54910 RepID=UPI003807EC86